MDVQKFFWKKKFGRIIDGDDDADDSEVDGNDDGNDGGHDENDVATTTIGQRQKKTKKTL